MKLNQTSYRLYLRQTGSAAYLTFQTGYASGTLIDAAIAAIAAIDALAFTTGNSLDSQD